METFVLVSETVADYLPIACLALATLFMNFRPRWMSDDNRKRSVNAGITLFFMAIFVLLMNIDKNLEVIARTICAGEESR